MLAYRVALNRFREMWYPNSDRPLRFRNFRDTPWLYMVSILICLFRGKGLEQALCNRTPRTQCSDKFEAPCT
jgi:hypothetical protein